ncbi:hypothetical protein KEM54_006262, partial [Ascosphaera aggregata]
MAPTTRSKRSTDRDYPRESVERDVSPEQEEERWRSVSPEFPAELEEKFSSIPKEMREMLASYMEYFNVKNDNKESVNNMTQHIRLLPYKAFTLYA